MDFDTNKYKVWTWKNPLMLHWMINPGLAFNELILGQAVPKVPLIEKSNTSPAARSFIPCPHCETIHSGLKWSFQNNTVKQRGKSVTGRVIEVPYKNRNAALQLPAATL